jgi:hypothetical protein
MSDIEPEPPSLAIVNARVWTGDPRRPWADALLLQAGRIETVGSSAEVRKRSTTATKVIDARGLVLSSSRVDGVLARGAPADLMLVDRPLDQLRVGAPNDADIVLAIEAGRIVTDRDSLAR